MKKRVTRSWIPFWGDKWLFGSMRQEFNAAERGIWWDLMAMAMKDEGYIRANEDFAYPIEQLSGFFLVPKKELQNAIDKFVKVKKLTRDEKGILYITNWNKYCFTDRHMRRLEDEHGDEKQLNQKDIFRKMSIKCPSEFSEMASAKGYVRMSRLVIAVILNRPLLPEEEVHHRDKDERNNYPNNLILFASHADHGKHEWGENIKPVWDGSTEKIEMSELSATMTRISATSIRKEKKREEEKRKEESIYIEEFKIFWDIYGVKVAQPDAFKAFKALRRKKIEFKTIKEAVKGYSNHLKNEPWKKQMYPASFLRNEKWKDFIGVTHEQSL